MKNCRGNIHAVCEIIIIIIIIIWQPLYCVGLRQVKSGKVMDDNYTQPKNFHMNTFCT